MSKDNEIVNEKRKKLPTWVKWLIAILAFATVTSLCLASGERHFFSAFIHIFIARTLYWTILFVPFIVGMMVIVKVEDYYGLKWRWLGWVLGIIVWFLLAFVTYGLVKHIPGVNWRVEKMIEADRDDDH